MFGTVDRRLICSLEDSKSDLFERNGAIFSCGILVNPSTGFEKLDFSGLKMSITRQASSLGGVEHTR